MLGMTYNYYRYKVERRLAIKFFLWQLKSGSNERWNYLIPFYEKIVLKYPLSRGVKKTKFSMSDKDSLLFKVKNNLHEGNLRHDRTRKKWFLARKKTKKAITFKTLFDEYLHEKSNTENVKLNPSGLPVISPQNVQFNWGHYHNLILQSTSIQNSEQYWKFLQFLFVHNNHLFFEIVKKNKTQLFIDRNGFSFIDYFIILKESPHNFFITLTDNQGNVLDILSKGLYYKNQSLYDIRSYKYSKKFIYDKMLLFFIKKHRKLLKKKAVLFKFKNMEHWNFFHKIYSKKFTKTKMFKYSGIINTTPRAHNGCRLRRKNR